MGRFILHVFLIMLIFCLIQPVNARVGYITINSPEYDLFVGKAYQENDLLEVKGSGMVTIPKPADCDSSQPEDCDFLEAMIPQALLSVDDRSTPLTVSSGYIQEWEGDFFNWFSFSGVLSLSGLTEGNKTLLIAIEDSTGFQHEERLLFIYTKKPEKDYSNIIQFPKLPPNNTLFGETSTIECHVNSLYGIKHVIARVEDRIAELFLTRFDSKFGYDFKGSLSLGGLMDGEKTLLTIATDASGMINVKQTRFTYAQTPRMEFSNIRTYIDTPRQDQIITGADLAISCFIESFYPIAAVKIKVDQLQLPLRWEKEGYQGDYYTGSLVISTLAGGEKELVVSVTDSVGITMEERTSFTVMNPPNLMIESPLQLDLARPDIPLKVRCQEEGVSNCSDIIRVTLNGDTVASGMNAIDRIISLKGFDGVQTLVFSAGQFVTPQKIPVIVESSRRLSERYSFQERILDIFNERILYAGAKRIGIFDASTQSHRRIPLEGLMTDGIENASGAITHRGVLIHFNGELHEFSGDEWRSWGQSSVPLKAGNFVGFTTPENLYVYNRISGTAHKVPLSMENSQIMPPITLEAIAANGDLIVSKGIPDVKSRVRTLYGIHGDAISLLGKGRFPQMDETKLVFWDYQNEKWRLTCYQDGEGTVLTETHGLEPEKGRYCLNHGWTAFQVTDAAGIPQIHMRSPQGNSILWSDFPVGIDYKILAVSSDGAEIVISYAGKNYLFRRGKTGLEISNHYDVAPFFRQGEWYQIINRTLFQINSESFVKQFPIANAGTDRIVAGVRNVVLDGSASIDPDGGPLEYQWRQIVGTRLPLMDDTHPLAALQIPDQEIPDPYLVFQLTVTNSVGFMNTDNLFITLSDDAFEPLEWAADQGGKGNWYQFFPFPRTWTEANVQAETLTYDGRSGHLATITNARESRFVTEHFQQGVYWLGGYQPSDFLEPAGLWEWVSGEPFEYSNWEMGMPDNALRNEQHLAMTADGEWDDLSEWKRLKGFLVEYESEPLPPHNNRIYWHVNFEQPGFYIISIMLDPDREHQEGLWELTLNPYGFQYERAKINRFYVGSPVAVPPISESVILPLILNFSLVANDTITLQLSDYLHGERDLNLSLFQTGLAADSPELIVGPAVLSSAKPLAIKDLAPESYLMELSGAKEPSAVGLVLESQHLSNKISFRGIMNTIGTEKKFSSSYCAFYLANPQSFDFLMKYGNSFPANGASKPRVEIYREDDEGARRLYWHSDGHWK